MCYNIFFFDEIMYNVRSSFWNTFLEIVSLLDNVAVPLLLGGGYRLKKLSVVGCNLPARMYGRAYDEIIGQPTLFKRHA
jgi:hypothetical protein